MKLPKLRLVALAVAGMALSVATLMLPGPGTALAATNNSAASLRPAIDARPCDESDPTPQIRLVLAPGAVICYGGTVGVIRVDDIYARGLASGGYWGYVTCDDLTQYLFDPNDFVRLDCNVIWIGITPPNWGTKASPRSMQPLDQPQSNSFRSGIVPEDIPWGVTTVPGWILPRTSAKDI